MKEIVITAKRINKELLLLLACFIFAFLLNVVAVIIYSTPGIEIFTQIGYVVAITLVLYFFIFLLRGINVLVKSLFRRA